MLKKLMRKIIDHTLLRSDATREQINNLCREACEYGFYSVCVNSCHVPYVKERLEGTDVRVSATVSFPLGAELTKAKVCESVEAVRNGADELDMVINIGALKGGDYALVYEELRAIREEIGEGICLKVILENCYLNQEEKIIGCLLSKYGGADFVKTSTGFGSGGAEPDDIRLMRMVVGEAMGIKAAGGIRGFDTACEMVSAGATRIGTSSSMKIIT
ncbi:MAG: deoxyribose-phosphate aldolase [Spirochaetes bacterium]|nr:MAG: deoxyribose-phosphate aldolase [Spirochaetota bacterium]